VRSTPLCGVVTLGMGCRRGENGEAFHDIPSLYLCVCRPFASVPLCTTTRTNVAGLFRLSLPILKLAGMNFNKINTQAWLHPFRRTRILSFWKDFLLPEYSEKCGRNRTSNTSPSNMQCRSSSICSSFSGEAVPRGSATLFPKITVRAFQLHLFRIQMLI
jgi:hypothetical protein